MKETFKFKWKNLNSPLNYEVIFLENNYKGDYGIVYRDKNGKWTSKYMIITDASVKEFEKEYQKYKRYQKLKRILK